MAIPTYTDFDLYWAKKVALMAKNELYGIGKEVNFWALLWEWMVQDATDHAADCSANMTICTT